MLKYSKREELKYVEQAEENIWALRYRVHELTDPAEKALLGLAEDADTTGLVAYEEVYEHGEPTVKRIQQQLLKEVEVRDSSAAVNEFSYNGVPMWLDKATRNGLLMRLQAEQAAGIGETVLWYKGVGYSVGTSDGIGLLMALEVYASRCFDRTERHKAEILKTDSIEELCWYDITAGYPEKMAL